MDRTMKTISGLFVLLLLCVPLSLAGLSDKDKAQGIQKPNTDDLYRPFLINNIFNYYGNNGDGSYNKFSGDNEGFEFPKGSGKHIIFEDGVVWGGFHKGFARPKVGGSVYRHGLQAGKLLTYGTPTTDPTADDPSLPKYRVYRVRPDITPATPLDDALKAKIQAEEVQYIGRYEAYSVADIYNQYVTDWNQWPAADGAPFKYGPGRGAPQAYDPTKDIPGQPGADQTLWYVANDENIARAANLSNSPPIGMEMQRTIWGYNRSGALGYTIFESTILINKSGAKVDSMFMVQWTDPDLGDAGDDFVGCDVPRSLGFVYNGKPVDGTYGSVVPAGGFTFFQGPIVPSPGDSAVFRLNYRHGFKNLKMSAFAIFTQGVPALTDPAQGVNGDVQWYNLMNGKIAASGADFINPKTGLAQKFVFNGDPVTGTGWVDGPPVAPPADRRMCLVTGPFVMAPGDTQELVVANIGAIGADRISSVAVLRYYSDLAQAVYNTLFNIPSPPLTPNVKVTTLDGEIILNWGDPVSANALENFTSLGYHFEGYNVYQSASVDGSNPKRLATFDIVDQVTTIYDNAYDDATGAVLFKPVEFGGDFGIQRVYDTKADALNSRGLVNGTKYYFAVTAYSYNPSPLAKPVQLESAPKWQTVIPQQPNPGVTYNSSVGSTLVPAHTTGIATAKAYATIVDPTAIHARNYEVRVVVTDSVLNPDLGFNVANPKWVIYDKDSNTPLTPASTYYTWDGASQVFEGVKFGIAGQPFYIAGQELGSLTWSPSNHFNFSGINDTPYPGDGFINSALAAYQVAADVSMEFTAAGQGQNAYDFIRTGSSGSAGAPYSGYYPQPFKVWELNPDGTHKRQIDFAFMEVVGSTYQNQVWAPGASSGDREYWFFITETYSPTAKAKYTAGITLNNALVQDSCVWSGWYVLTDPAKPAYSPGDVWTIKTSKIVTPADKWTYSTVGLATTTSNAQALNDITRINVWPNPYIGFNSQELNKYQRFVTFSHLPKNATLRIFNLAGVLIRTLMKSDDTQFIQWDLKNTNGFPAAAGMYVVYIDMPDLGVTRTLKLGIIPEQQYIDRW